MPSVSELHVRIREQADSLKERNGEEQLFRLGRWVRALRERKGLTQARLAELAGVTPACLSHIENEKREATSSTLKKIVTALGVDSMADFFYEVERNESPVHRLDERVTMISPEEQEGVTVQYLGPRNRVFKLYWMYGELAPGAKSKKSPPQDEDASIMVTEGLLGIEIDEENHVIHPGEVCFIPAHAIHRTRNLSEDTTTKYYFVSCVRERRPLGRN